MIVLYLALALCGFVAGFLTCWIIARSAALELAALFEPLGYKLVDGEWTRPDDPYLPRQKQVDVDRVMVPRRQSPRPIGMTAPATSSQSAGAVSHSEASQPLPVTPPVSSAPGCGRANVARQPAA